MDKIVKMKKQITNFALNPDEETLRQFKACYSEKYVVKAALMPDAHVGYVAPIGAVLVTKDVLVPAWVGYDIGCGMTAAKLPKLILKDLKLNEKKIYEEVKKKVPMGLGEIHIKEEEITATTQEEYNHILNEFKKGQHSKQVLQFLESGKALRNLGSLGHGNHFISLNSDGKKVPWIVVHSGSRSVGHWVATLYMQKSSGKKENYEETHPLSINSEEGKEYQNFLDFGLEFAKLNRLEIIRQVVIAIEKVLGKKIKYEIWTNKNHNHALKENGLFIHRKGATPAKRGERGIIPANMKDGSFLVEGKGNKEFLSSSSHGAGRVMSRREAREKLSVNKFKEEMEKAKVIGNFSESSLDEAPEVYKDIKKVLDAQKKSIKVVNHLIPFINWQGEGRRRG
ncbi:MAG: RtcB family protein [Nanoarchaeota archaeon]|nr:RtcB family protein [Nanoarchaeota archaeon]